MVGELTEVFDRYGVVVLGYSGEDPGIAAPLRARRTHYGLWWVTRGTLGERAQDLVAATGGRVISRENASVFLEDLQLRLRVFAQHPSGLTPDVMNSETLGLIRAEDEVGLDELLRRERQDYTTRLRDLHAEALHRLPNAESAAEVWGTLLPVMERRLASLLPLALHRPDRFADELLALARQLEDQDRRLLGGSDTWTGMAKFAAAWLGYITGALLMLHERWEAVRPLVAQTWFSEGGYEEPVVDLRGAFGHQVGSALAPKGANWLSQTWEFVTQSLGPSTWLSEPYPELTGDGQPRSAMVQFDLLCCLARGAAGHNSRAFFTLSGGESRQSSVEFAQRLHRDERMRNAVSAATGLPADGFADAAREALKHASLFERGAIHIGPNQIASIIETGNWNA
jgi:hypothetical protein